MRDAADVRRRERVALVGDEERRAVAQFIIANGGDLGSLADATIELWDQLELLLESKNS